MYTKTLSTVLAAAAVFLAGCDNSQQVEQIRQEAERAIAEARQEAADAIAAVRPLAEDVPRKAVAILHPTEGNDVAGTVVFTPISEGLQVAADVSGLTPGEHGYHIHLYGDCTAPDGTSAGTHFNLDGSSLNPPADIDRITGDLGNLEAGDDGKAVHEAVLENAELAGAKSIIGRAVIVHEKPNDPGQPPIGAAGSRQACGVIGIANPS